MNFTCDFCKKEFETSPSKRINKHIYCSKECSYNAMRGVKHATKKITLTCKSCGNEFEVIPSRVSKAKYCSKKCTTDSSRGSGNPNWRGGVSPHFNADEIWWNIRKLALERDNFECAICDSPENLEVHHIIPYRLIGKHELENLVTLCSGCHIKFEQSSIPLLAKGGVPIGHPEFSRIILELWLLHLRKNRDYATQDDPLANFKRVGEWCKLYKLITPGNEALKVAIIYSLKQMDAALKLIGDATEGQVEGVPDRLRDMAVYSVLEEIIYGECE